MFGLRFDDAHRVEHQGCVEIGNGEVQVHKGRRYAFGGLITRLCRAVGVSKENLDYIGTTIPSANRYHKDKGA